MFSKQEFIKKTVNTITVGIKIDILKEGDYFVVYCPALQLSSYADDVDVAKERFTKEIKIFFEETQKKGTLEKMLLQLGWTLTKSPKPRYEPPRKNIFMSQTRKFKSFTEKIAIPV